ncbi:tol-pal system protein YbgF [Pseudovibrio exalbescens]|uniref:tol-pal system protein YbgF n=1 Tax=Pseudovibrio exalbescens TaxID=197461 RepID=UPI002366E8A5|nr:tol-pal system protein YbgF [Pseudovibrio exalbescens]MDD7911920.1 tol-pal system protein YbgF [Pseudovibrio exalbescens]
MALNRTVATYSLAILLSASVAVPASAQLFGSDRNEAAQATARLGQLEEQIRSLTGQVEQLQFQVRTLEDQLRRSQEDNEYRLQQLEGGAPSGPRQQGNLNQPTRSQPQQQQAQPVNRTAQTQNLSNTAQGGTSGPLDLSALAQGSNGAPNAAGTASQSNILVAPGGEAATFNGNVQASITGDPSTDYNMFYDLVLKGNYPAAAEGFDTFLGMYPDHALAPNAQYWYGESLLSQRNYRKAADAFLKAYTDYPSSDLAPDSLLKLGLSLSGLGERDAACATYSELLGKFPSAPSTILNQARTEQSRAGCS